MWLTQEDSDMKFLSYIYETFSLKNLEFETAIFILINI